MSESVAMITSTSNGAVDLNNNSKVVVVDDKPVSITLELKTNATFDDLLSTLSLEGVHIYKEDCFAEGDNDKFITITFATQEDHKRGIAILDKANSPSISTKLEGFRHSLAIKMEDLTVKWPKDKKLDKKSLFELVTLNGADNFKMTMDQKYIFIHWLEPTKFRKCQLHQSITLWDNSIIEAKAPYQQRTPDWVGTVRTKGPQVPPLIHSAFWHAVHAAKLENTILGISQPWIKNTRKRAKQMEINFIKNIDEPTHKKIDQFLATYFKMNLPWEAVDLNAERKIRNKTKRQNKRDKEGHESKKKNLPPIPSPPTDPSKDEPPKMESADGPTKNTEEEPASKQNAEKQKFKTIAPEDDFPSGDSGWGKSDESPTNSTNGKEEALATPKRKMDSSETDKRHKTENNGQPSTTEAHYTND